MIKRIIILIPIVLVILAVAATAQDDEFVEITDIDITARPPVPQAISFLYRTEPEFEMVMLRQTYESQILNPIDKEEFEEGLGFSTGSIQNPLIWLTTGAGIAAGLTAGYMDSNTERLNANWLAGTAGAALLTATIIMLIER
jgi:hypothetical protein